MAREKGLYRRKESPYWWINVVLPDGRRVCKSTRLKILADANEYLINLKQQSHDDARTGLKRNKTWRESVVRYIRENPDKKSLRYDLENFRKLDPYLGNKRLEQICMDLLWLFIHERREVDGVQPATINRALEVVRRILHLARDEWNWLSRFPRIKMLREPKRRIRFLTREEADTLLEALPAHLHAVVQFALSTGCRMSEILQLDWQRVDFDRRVAWLDPGTTKNGEGRGIPLNKEAALALRSVQGQHARWCFTYKGKPMKAIGSSWKRVLKKVGIENFRFHDCRHTWASWHVMNGTNLQELMELGGWKSYEMVLRYAHLAPEYLAHAASRIERKWDTVTVNENATISLQ